MNEKLKLDLDKETVIFLYNKFKDSEFLPTDFLVNFRKIEKYIYNYCSLEELENVTYDGDLLNE